MIRPHRLAFIWGGQRPGERHARGEIQLHSPIPDLVADLVNGLGCVAAGVVDQDVHPSHDFERGLRQRANLLSRGHVGHMVVNGRIRDSAGRLPETLLPAATDHHLGPRPRKSVGHGSTQPLAAAGDQRGPTAQIEDGSLHLIAPFSCGPEPARRWYQSVRGKSKRRAGNSPLECASVTARSHLPVCEHLTPILTAPVPHRQEQAGTTGHPRRLRCTSAPIPTGSFPLRL